MRTVVRAVGLAALTAAVLYLGSNPSRLAEARAPGSLAGLPGATLPGLGLTGLATLGPALPDRTPPTPGPPGSELWVAGAPAHPPAIARTARTAGVSLSDTEVDTATSVRFGIPITRAGIPARATLVFPRGTRFAQSPTSTSGLLAKSGPTTLTWRPTTATAQARGSLLTLNLEGVTTPPTTGPALYSATVADDKGSQLGKVARPIGIRPFIAPPKPAALPRRTGCPTKWPTIATENARPGSTDWRVATETYDPAQGTMFASATSATCGDVIDLKIHSTSPVRLSAYRIGFYQGSGARLIWTGTAPAHAQPMPSRLEADPAAQAPPPPVDLTGWKTTARIPITAAFRPGTYLIRAHNDTHAWYTPLTVRDDTATRHRYLLIQATTTWQAYNQFGGSSAYRPVGFAASQISSHRPYLGDYGAGEFLSLERALISWIEEKGLDASYWTDEDLHRFGALVPARTKNLLFPAHDEYYSTPMRRSVRAAIRSGVSVATFGANFMFRKMEFTSPSTWRLRRSHHGHIWRYVSPGGHEQSIMGAEYGTGVTPEEMTVETTDSWLFTGLAPGTNVPLIFGEEDGIWPSVPLPAGRTEALAQATLTRPEGPVPFNPTATITPAGVRIFNGSTFGYSCVMDGSCLPHWQVPDGESTRSQMRLIVGNVFRWLGEPGMPSTLTAARSPLPAPTPPAQVLDDRRQHSEPTLRQ